MLVVLLLSLAQCDQVDCEKNRLIG